MKETKGIILAGGYGTRLYPLTIGVSKQLLPVYDKPMIYYPLSVLMTSGIRNILIISTSYDTPKFKKLLGDGSKFGIKISYEIQQEPKGIAESLIISSDFIGSDNICLILGDNIFYKLDSELQKAKTNLAKNFCTIFGVRVNNPENFGVVSFDPQNNFARIVEKPNNPKSNLIVSGLYYYTNDVIEIAKKLKPSKRGELEITDINNIMLSKNKLSIIELDSKVRWIDTGTYNSLLKASDFFHKIENNTGKKFACPEEIAYNLNFINREKLDKIAKSMEKSEYGKYLINILKNEI